MKLVVAIVLFFGIQAQAQDKVYYNDGKTAEVKVLKVTETTVEFKKWSDQEGATHEVGVDKINMVVYQNGEHQTFTDVKAVKTSGKKVL